MFTDKELAMEKSLTESVCRGNLKECVNGSDGVTFLRTKRA